MERLDFKEDFVTIGKAKGIVPLPTLPHEPCVFLLLRCLAVALRKASITRRFPQGSSLALGVARPTALA